MNAAPEPAGRRRARGASAAVLPDAGAAGAPLSAAIGVVSLLAALALAGAVAIVSVTGRWTSDVESQITVRVSGDSAEAVDAGADAAMRVLSTTAGVASADPVSRAEAEDLLAPWLGSEGLPDDFPVPALIAVDFADGAAPDLELLAARIAAAAPGAAIDDHSGWNERLVSSARALQATAVLVFLLVLGAAAAVATFAARASLAANDDIVDVLHLMGATDAYIANAVQRRLLTLAGVGAGAGFVSAVVVYAVVGALLARAGDGAFAGATGGGSVYFWLPLAPLACVAAAAFAGRRAALGALARRL